MAPLKTLTGFAVSETKGRYSIRIEDDAGGTLELAVTRDQLDVMVDTLEDLLLLDEMPDGGKDEDREG